MEGGGAFIEGAQQRGQGARGGGVKRRRAREVSVERPDAGQCGGHSCDGAGGEEPNGREAARRRRRRYCRGYSPNEERRRRRRRRYWLGL